MIHVSLILHPRTGSGSDNISNFLVSFLNEFILYYQAKIRYYYIVVIFAVSDGRSRVGSGCLTQKLSAEWVYRLFCECLVLQDFLNLIKFCVLIVNF